MGWQTVEHWQAQSPHGMVWELRLKQVVDDPFSTAWRVEWGQQGHQHKGASFTGDGREERARELLELRKSKYVDGEWECLS